MHVSIRKAHAVKPITPKIRAIIFDIGRVLVDVDATHPLVALEGLTLSPEEVWPALEKDPRWRDWQEGKITPRDWHLYMARRFGGKVTYEKFTESWNAVLNPIPLQDSAFLERLSKRYCLALLSNTDALHVAHMEGSYDFFQFFPHRIYSCAVGVCKPDPLIYRHALRACKVRAEQAVFIDDIPANVQGAQRLGLRGIVFRSPTQLLSDLRELGINVD
ncbi:MAG: HAD family phosphatase [Candidatus Acidiferrum sp.]